MENIIDEPLWYLGNDEKLAVLKRLKEEAKLFEYLLVVFETFVPTTLDIKGFCFYWNDCLYSNVRVYAYMTGFGIDRQSQIRRLGIGVLGFYHNEFVKTVFKFEIYPFYSVYVESTKRKWYPPKLTLQPVDVVAENPADSEFLSDYYTCVFESIAYFFASRKKSNIIYKLLQEEGILLSERLANVYTYNQDILDANYDKLVKGCSCKADFERKLCRCERLCREISTTIFPNVML